MTDNEKREKNKAVLRRLYDHMMEIAAGGREEISKIFTDDCVMELPHLNAKQAGLDAMVAGVQSVPRNFSHYRLKSMTFHDCVDPDELIYEAEADAVFRHTGQPYLQRYINIINFRNGKICRNVEYMNMNLLGGFPPQPQQAQKASQ